MKKTILLVLILFAFHGVSWALSPGTVGPAFLRIGVGARAAGMGEAFAAGGDDVSCIPWNPAGLGLVHYPQATFMHMTFLGDTNYDALSYAQPIGLGTVAGSLMFLRIPEFDNTEGLEPSVASGSYALSASYGAKLGYLYPFGSELDNVLLGASVKWAGLSISGVSAMNYLMADLGAAYKTPLKGLRVGASLLNLGASVSGVSYSSALPFAGRAGLAYEVSQAIVTLDVIQYLDQTLYFNSGVELWWEKILALRAGAKLGGPNTDVMRGLTIGGGWQVSSFRLDYAYMPNGDLGAMHRFSGTMAFGQLEVGSARLGNVDDLNRQGMIYYEEGFLEQGIECWKRSLEIKPDQAKVKRWIKIAEKELAGETQPPVTPTPAPTPVPADQPTPPPSNP